MSILLNTLKNDIVNDLRRIEAQYGTALMASCVDRLLHNMRVVWELSPPTGFVEVMMALHDALAYKNRWAEYQADAFGGAYRVLKKIAQPSKPDKNQVEKAIMDLDALGFEILPYELGE